MNTDMGWSSRAAARAASAAGTRTASAATAASRVEATESSFGCSSAFAAAHLVSNSAIRAIVLALMSSARPLASGETAELIAISADASSASARSFRFSATRTAVMACAASREAVTAASLARSAFRVASSASAARGSSDRFGTRLCGRQGRVRYLNGRHVMRGHNDAHSHPRRVEQMCRELERHSNAAMGCRTTWQNTPMECDAGPGDALHVRHVRIVIQVGIVLGILLDDAENARRCLASLLAARRLAREGSNLLRRRP